MTLVHTPEAEEFAIHHIERPVVEGHEVQQGNFMRPHLVDVDDWRDCDTQVHQYTQSDGRVRPAKPGQPNAQTQLNCRDAQGIRPARALWPNEFGVAIQFERLLNRCDRHVRSDVSVTGSTGVDQRRSAHAVTQFHRTRLATAGSNRRLGVAQTSLALIHLRKCHRVKQYCATQATVAAVAIYDLSEALPWHELHIRFKKTLAGVQEQFFRGVTLGNSQKVKNLKANRCEIKSTALDHASISTYPATNGFGWTLLIDISTTILYIIPTCLDKVDGNDYSNPIVRALVMELTVRPLILNAYFRVDYKASF